MAKRTIAESEEVDTPVVDEPLSDTPVGDEAVIPDAFRYGTNLLTFLVINAECI